MLKILVLLCLALIMGCLLASISDLSIGRAIRRLRMLRYVPARVRRRSQPNPNFTPPLQPKFCYVALRAGSPPGDPLA